MPTAKKQKKNPTKDVIDSTELMASLNTHATLEFLEDNEEDEPQDELPHKEPAEKELEVMHTPKPINKETSETTLDHRNDFSIEKKLKAERLSHMITQAVEKELMKVETKTNNYTVDYCRTTNVLKGVSELVDKLSYLNQEQRRLESDLKKLMAEVSKDIINHEVLNEHLNWSHIVDISKKGRGITVQYNDGSNESSFAKLNEYASLKVIELKKFPDNNTYVLNKQVMDKITQEYLKREDGGQLMDNIETIIRNHKHDKELFDEDFFEDFFKE